MLGSQEFTPTGWVARYKYHDGREEEFPVETWSSDGDAMIVDYMSGRLTPVWRREGFAKLDRVDRIVTAVPAAPGWRVKLEGEPGDFWEEPIAAWLVTDQGHIHPVLDFGDEGYGGIPADANHAHILNPGPETWSLDDYAERKDPTS